MKHSICYLKGTLCRILNYSAEHPKIPGNYSMDSYLLRIEKKNAIFSGSKQIPQWNIMLSQENMQIFTKVPDFAVHFSRVLWFCPPRLNFKTCQYPTQKGKFLKSIETVAEKCFVKEVFLEILQNSLENTCGRVSILIRLQAWGPATFLKSILWQRCFPVKFAKFLRTPFLTEPHR